MKRIALMFITLVFGILIGSVAFGQTVSPAAEEFKGQKFHGTIMVTNPSGGIVDVKIMAQGFDWKNGQPHLAPITGVQFSTKQQSLTLGPNQSKAVDFKAECDSSPCNFYVASGFTPHEKHEGLTLVMWLPVAIYSCPDKARGCRMRTLKSHGAL